MIAAMSLLGALLPLVAAAETPAAQGANCEEFDVTGFSICGEFLEFWNANGGLPVFGYPLTDAFEEKNPDTGETYLVQYFERQRFELHPENAGTVYSVLFGRLGAQILDLQGRDWMTFPKASPDAAHYFEVTGHAIAPEFWAYWSSHGLELGDKGISFRESLMLFGYPISEPAMETNADGDTVLTQWFERAVFEFHPNNPAEHQVLLRRVGAELLEMMQPSFEFDVVAEGFDNPRHLDAGADGTLYVAEAGRGGDQCFTISAEGEGEEDSQVCYGQTGGVTDVMTGESLADMWSAAEPSGMFATGTHSVAVAPDGTIYAVVGEAIGVEGAPAGEFWHLVKVNADGSTTMVADLLAYEETNNPDGLEDAPPDQGGEPGIHSNPYGVVATDAGLFVVDAGGNSVLMVTYDGTITTYGVFPIVEVEAPEFLGAPPGTMIPMQPVPTSATVGPDGALYVGQLTGFPFPTGGASVFRLEDTNNDGDALDEGEMTVYADGLSAILDLEFGPDNNLYVVEMAREGLLALEMGDPNNPAPGSVVKIGPDGTQTVIASEGLIAPSGIEIMGDGTIYVTNFGIMPGAGQVVKLHYTTAVVSVVASELNNPRGIYVTADGDVYVAEAGTGGEECLTRGEGEEAVELCFGSTGAVTLISGGEQVRIASALPSLTSFGGDATGPQDVVVGDMGQVYVIVGLGADPAERAVLAGEVGDLVDGLGYIITLNEDGSWEPVADVSAIETSDNPDGGALDSNPYSLVLTESGFVVSDAGMNAVLAVHPGVDETTHEVLGVFEARMVEAPEFIGAPPGTMIPMESVPTGIVQGPDGAYYVGELTGFPFEVGAARVWRVPGGGAATVEAEGFTNIIDVAFDSHGNMYVLEINKNSLLAVDPADLSTMAGALYRVSPDGTKTMLLSQGLVMPTGMAIGADDTIYISNYGVVPGQGQVISLSQ